MYLYVQVLRIDPDSLFGIGTGPWPIYVHDDAFCVCSEEAAAIRFPNRKVGNNSWRIERYGVSRENER